MEREKLQCSDLIIKHCDSLNFSSKTIIPNPLFNLNLLDLAISDIEVKNSEYDVTNLIGSDRDSFYDLTWKNTVIKILKNKDDYNFKCDDTNKLGY